MTDISFLCGSRFVKDLENEGAPFAVPGHCSFFHGASSFFFFLREIISILFLSFLAELLPEVKAAYLRSSNFTRFFVAGLVFLIEPYPSPLTRLT